MYFLRAPAVPSTRDGPACLETRPRGATCRRDGNLADLTLSIRHDDDDDDVEESQGCISSKFDLSKDRTASETRRCNV